jgi:hypothetical protein
MRTKLPAFATTKQAYVLLWRHVGLHAKAIWPPIVFLAAAEFVYHKMIGDTHSLSGKLSAALASPWYLVAAALAWLAGLKFLLSFSISWRRHLLLGEGFDPFYFKKPFWMYLGFLILTYVWALAIVSISLIPGSASLIGGSEACDQSTGLWQRLGCTSGTAWWGMLVPGLAIVLILWAIIRQVPYFTALTLGARQPGWKQSVSVMRGNVLRYAVAWLLAMLPVMALSFLLDFVVQVSGVDVTKTTVALGESAFRQAMLFLHFSLGASIGALTYAALLRNEKLTSLQ